MVKIKHEFNEIKSIAKKAVKSLLRGFCGIIWVVILFFVNIAITLYSASVRAIRCKPCISVAVTFLIMCCVVFATHVKMKVKLTTAEYQRDQLEIKLDSIKVVKGEKNSYGYQAYKSK